MGRLPYIWFHVPNEFSGQYRGAFGAKQHAMGKICGIPDYAFLGKHRSFFVEVKYGNNKQSENQQIIQQWCENIGVQYYLCRSVEEVKGVL